MGECALTNASGSSDVVEGLSNEDEGVTVIVQ